MDAYLEAGLGYSHQINDKWTVGGKVKFLYGIANASTFNNSLELTAGMDQWTLRGSGTLNVSSPLLLSVSEEAIGYEMPGSVMDWVRPSGLGAGIDLGVTYKPIEALTLSAAVTDLGFIRWQGNPNNVTYSIDYAFDGFVDENTDLSDESWQEGVMDTLANALTNSMNYELGGTNPFTTSTSPKLNVGAEYGLWDYKLSFGVLSRTMLHKRRLYEEVTLAITGRPANWFNLGVSYSFLNGNFGSMGIGVGLRSGIINWFVTADYVSLSNARLPLGLEGGLSNLAIPVPYKAKGMNFAVGINFVFGNKQDRDRDGVKDKFDLCPDTPRKVLVDEHGCPLDTDGDGVPDYLDQCPGTPSTAKGMVDSIGCPLDTDGDGVFDYEDQCPDTPEAAYGQVGPDGCPLDTDGDGVPDYMDKCPDTPPPPGARWTRTAARSTRTATACPTTSTAAPTRPAKPTGRWTNTVARLTRTATACPTTRPMPRHACRGERHGGQHRLPARHGRRRRARLPGLLPPHPRRACQQRLPRSEAGSAQPVPESPARHPVRDRQVHHQAFVLSHTRPNRAGDEGQPRIQSSKYRATRTTRAARSATSKSPNCVPPPSRPTW